ncbi:VanZ family protein [Romboutsia timonensis]|uniref:VanZ family protein n=1 Tax=Romboutsia timonensis TaxID=1776391 RepID=UPI0008D9F428|nr:VanZ family protein [Romboutsia timonensis]
MIEFSESIFLGVTFFYLGMVIIYDYFMNNKFNYKDRFIDLSLFLSFIFIISQTLFPIELDANFDGFEVYNLIPFRVPINIYLNYDFSYFIHQVFGNIVLFIPFGFFIFLKNSNVRKSILIIFLLTLSIEFIQGFIPYRFCEIDDLWLNTLGGYIGILIAKIINKGHIKALN